MKMNIFIKRKEITALKIKAATLVETIVALTILSLVSGFAIVIFLNVSGPGSSIEAMVRAQQKTAEIMDSLEINARIPEVYIDLQQENLYYEGYAEEYEPGIWQMHLTVKDNEQRTIYTRKRLFYEPAEE